MKKTLVINPGSTSTKIAVYEGENAVFTKGIMHDAAYVVTFDTIPEQVPFRYEVIEKTLIEEGIALEDLGCVMCRGGIIMAPPLQTGGYEVNDDLCYALSNDELTAAHASLLGGLLGKIFSDKLGIPAYIYDAVTAGSLDEVAQVTGFVDIKRRVTAHVLNGRAMAIKYAQEQGKNYEDLNIIVAHLGGGSSCMAHKNGRIVETIGDDEGHMSAERAGSAPLISFTDLCFSGKYNKGEVKKLLRGKGGLWAHLGTSDGREIQARAEAGDEKAKLMMEAMSYQIAKSIASVAVALEGKVDAVVVTGGLAYSKPIAEMITKYASFVGPVVIMPGENEMEALALGGYRIMKGEEKAHTYKLPEGYKK